MKKILCIILSLLTITQIGAFTIFAKESNSYPIVNEKNFSLLKSTGTDVKTRLVSWNNIIYEIYIESTPETSSYDVKTGEITHHKTVVEEEKYYSAENHSLLLSQKLSVRFSYNGEKAWIDNKNEISYTPKIEDTNWKFVENIEYLNDDPTECLFSTVWKLYSRETRFNDWDYMDTAFFDVTCTSTGELRYNYK